MQFFDLNGKNVLVTGAAGLLGVSHVEAILESNGNPIMTDINSDRLGEVAARLFEKYSATIDYYQTDISQEQEVESLAKLISKKHGDIHGLINNAANNPKVEDCLESSSRLENFSLETWQKDLAVGLTGSFLCAKHIGHLIAQNPLGGSIVNVASDLALIAPNQKLYEIAGISAENQPVKPVTYSVIKSGLLGLTRYIATYWNKENVRCNAICPGGVKNGQDEDFLNKVQELIPLGRMATPDQYKGSIVYLLSEASSYMTGSVLTVDGGRTCW